MIEQHAGQYGSTNGSGDQYRLASQNNKAGRHAHKAGRHAHQAGSAAGSIGMSAHEDELLLVVLKVGKEQYGVAIQHVEEIQSFTQVTPVPGMPSFWSGIVNLRGHLYAVLHLGHYLQLAADPNEDEPKIAFVRAAGLELALLVDDVLEVRRVLQAEIGPSLIHSSKINREAIRGLTGDLLSVLDLHVLLSDPKLVVQDQIN